MDFFKCFIFGKGASHAFCYKSFISEKAFVLIGKDFFFKNNILQKFSIQNITYYKKTRSGQGNIADF